MKAKIAKIKNIAKIAFAAVEAAPETLVNPNRPETTAITKKVNPHCNKLISSP